MIEAAFSTKPIVGLTSLHPIWNFIIQAFLDEISTDQDAFKHATVQRGCISLDSLSRDTFLHANAYIAYKSYILPFEGVTMDDRSRVIAYLKQIGVKVDPNEFHDRLLIQKIVYLLKLKGLDIKYHYVNPYFGGRGIYSKELADGYCGHKMSSMSCKLVILLIRTNMRFYMRFSQYLIFLFPYLRQEPHMHTLHMNKEMKGLQFPLGVYIMWTCILPLYVDTKIETVSVSK